MWNLGNRGVVVLISALSGCAFLYNIWGPILFLATSLFLVLYVCYSLVVNDSPLSPHAFILFEYIRGALLEAHSTVQRSLRHISQYGRNSWQIVDERCRAQLATIMNRPRRSHYQLSTDSYSHTKNSPTLSSIARLSPIPRNTCKTETHDTGTENKICNDSIPTTYRRSVFGKHTSTPMLPREKHTSANGDCEFFSSSQVSPKKLQSPYYSLNQTSSTNERGTSMTSDTSPWGTNVSPKMRPKGSGMKTVQTVAGPLLASTRYNIDPKVYNDVTSPGLTTRLTKYATEANTTLTHQAQYSAGQFPRINLHAGPVPVISPKTAKIRSPVTVRIAPPDSTRYSPPGRQKVLSHLCQAENKSPPSVVQVLREISLKRHASREDVTSELPKKQRTDSIICEGYEPIDETKQKRSRDDSSKSEEEISPQNKTVRPAKRTKTPSCYDILNSLSSSIHVASGVKRKAMDFSRSGTPQFEKHFKSLESSPSAQIVPQPQSHGNKSSAPVAKATRNAYPMSPSGKSPEQASLKGILKPSSQSPANIQNQVVKISQTQKKNSKAVEGNNTVIQPVNLTDKLFMKPEPEKNERLKMLAEEQRSMKPKFTTDDVEEIKKEDIVNMRKTSMKARLQSMFDAISGKAPSKINPDVVIEAEEIGVSKPAPCPVTCATLNSSTTTTNVNTTPISTSAVAPVAATSADKMTSLNRVTFNVPKTGSSPLASSSSTAITNTKSMGSFSSKTTTVSAAPLTASAISAIATRLKNSVPPHSSIIFGNQPSPAAPIPSADSSHSTVTTGNKVVPLVTPAAITTTPSSISVATNTIFGTKSSSVPTSITPNQTMGNNTANLTNASSIAQPLATSQGASTFKFGDKATSATSTEDTKITSKSIAAPTSLFSTISSGSTSTSPAISSTVIPASTTASLFTFGNKTGNLETPKPQVASFDSSGSTSNALVPAFGSTVTSSNNFTNAPVTTTSTGPSLALSSTSSATNIQKATAPVFGPATTTTFSFSAVTTAATLVKSGFSFGSNIPNVVSTSAGTPTTTATVALAASTSIAPTMINNASIVFGSVSTTTTPQFGSTTTTTSIFSSTSSAPMFGTMSGQSVFSTSVTSPTTSSFATPSTSVISGTFGTTATTKQATFGAFSTPSTTGTFGTPTSRTGLFATPTTAATASTFGALPSTGTVSAFGGPSTAGTGSAFGTPSAAGTSSAFSTPTTMGSGSAFGAPSSSSTSSAFSAPTNFGTGSSFGIPKTTASLFGPTLTSPSTSSLTTTTSTPIFGTGNIIPSSASTPTTSNPVFGASLGAPSGTTSSSGTNLFANANANASNVPTPAPSFSETTNIFGQAKPTMAFGGSSGGFSGSTPLFGSQTTSAPAFGTATATNSIASPAFGAASTSTPAFGSIAPQPAQSASTSGLGSTPSLFGNNNAPSTFGTPSSSFNASGSRALGSQNPTSPTFGAIGNSGGFSDNKSSMFGSQTSGTSAFGAPNTSTPAFGANANSGNTSSSIFTFGAGQQKPPQQSSTFVFGGNAPNNNNPGTAPTPFQFGASAPKPTTGFNFTPPAATPTINFGTSGTPTFNASTPGMFSIGSGSTAPRSRSARNRKPK